MTPMLPSNAFDRLAILPLSEHLQNSTHSMPLELSHLRTQYQNNYKYMTAKNDSRSAQMPFNALNGLGIFARNGPSVQKIEYVKILGSQTPRPTSQTDNCNISLTGILSGENPRSLDLVQPSPGRRHSYFTTLD